MEFNSLNFAIFLTLVILVYFKLLYRNRWILLLAASFLFILSFGAHSILTMIFAATFSYFCAIKIEQVTERRLKRLLLIVGICLNLMLLFLMKYMNVDILRMFGLVSLRFPSDWLVPIGISFYTLQIISYLCDVYNSKISAERNFRYYILYVAFFPTIVCGPIERAQSLLPQLQTSSDFSYDRVRIALGRITWGLFKKVVVADRLALYVGTVYDNVHYYTGWPLIIATFFYSIQLYCDFSGYTDIAIGTANAFGYKLTENFNYPYFSGSVKEFWNRWHISLSTWLRDYVYFPLGGSRGSLMQYNFNLLTVFLVSGLWHGLNLTFIVWGLLHGFFLVVENTFKTKTDFIFNINKNSKAIKLLKVLVTFTAVNFSWIFFRADSITDASFIIKNLFTDLSVINKENISLNVGNFKIIVLSVVIFALLELSRYKGWFKAGIRTKPVYIRWAAYYIIVMFILIFGVFQNSQFVYGQF